MRKIFVYTFFTIFFTTGVFGQIKSGEVTYGLKFHSKASKSEEVKKNPTLRGFADAIEKAEDLLNFKLIFNESKSLFYKEKILTIDIDKTVKVMVSSINPGTYFYNSDESNKVYKQNKGTSKEYVVVLNKEDLNWKLTQEKKIIGNHTCFKAIGQKNVTINDKSISYDVIAWYTPNLNYNYGPNEYLGLPGLVLEVVDYKYTLYLKELAFNLTKKKATLIKKPTGIEVSQNEFSKILKAKTNKLKSRSF
jgi:GLPGLI family protein